MKNIKIMKEFGKKLAVVVCMMVLGLSLSGGEGLSGLLQVETSHAQDEADRDGFINDETVEVLEGIQSATGLPGSGFEKDNDIVKLQGLNRISGIVLSVISVLKYVVGGISVLYLTISLVRIIASTDPEEELAKLKTYIGYLVFAVVLVLSADVFFLQVLDLGGDTFLGSEEAAKNAARIGSAEIKGIVRVIEAVIGVLALFFLIIAGMRMVANAGNEEAVDKAKKQIIYSAAGILMVMISESLVREIFFVNDGQGIDVDAANRFILTLTNFISGFVAFAALVSLMYAGFRYIFTPGDDDNAGRVKNAVIGGVVGIIIAAGAFAIVNTIIRLDPADGAGLPPAAETYFDGTFSGV